MSDKEKMTENQDKRRENTAQEEHESRSGDMDQPEEQTAESSAGESPGEKNEDSGEESPEKASGKKKDASRKFFKKQSAEEKALERAETAEQKLAEMQDRYIRLSAEFDNYRKRTMKEKMDLQRAANEDILTHLLGVKDDFERAMESVQTAKDVEAVKAGVDLIYNKFAAFFTQHGVREIEAMGKEFDTDVHEAVTKIKVDDAKQKGKVVDVIEKGYTLKEKVIRFSKVVIGE